MTDQSVYIGFMITKEQILFAAGQVFSQVGYSQSTIQDIATAAEIGKGTVYSFFESKPEILFEACRVHIDFCKSEMEEFKKIAGFTLSQKIEKLLEYFILQIIPNQSKSCFLFYELLVLAATDKNYQGRIAELLRSRQIFTEKVFMDYYEEGLATGEFHSLDNPLEFIRSFTSSVDGLIFQYSFRADDLFLEKQLAYEQFKFRAILFKGK